MSIRHSAPFISMQPREVHMNARFRQFSGAAYVVAVLLILIPVGDSLLGVWPIRAGDTNWRFGALGLGSRVVMTPALGMLVALVAAAALDHRRIMRALAVVSFLGGAAAALAATMFAFDALQTRAQVRPDSLAGFDTAAVVALVKYGLGVVTGAVLGVAGWRAARIRAGDPRQQGSESAKRERPGATGGIIVGAPTEASR